MMPDDLTSPLCEFTGDCPHKIWRRPSAPATDDPCCVCGKPLAGTGISWTDQCGTMHFGCRDVVMHHGRAYRVDELSPEALRELDWAIAPAATDEDDGCPKGDPGCDGGEGDCHDACEHPPALHCPNCGATDGGGCGQCPSPLSDAGGAHSLPHLPRQRISGRVPLAVVDLPLLRRVRCPYHVRTSRHQDACPLREQVRRTQA